VKASKKVILILLPVLMVSVLALLRVDAYMKSEALPYIVTLENAPQADAILVLGARVHPDGGVSVMLGDRLETALELNAAGKSNKFIVSGDHGQVNYDEVNTMKNFLMQRQIPAERIFMDHAGFSTYESMYRARDIFKAQKILIVTQQYHLMRAVYAARQLGLEAYGVASDKQEYSTMPYNQTREVFARNKDFVYLNILKPKPTYLGEPIPLTSDGRLTSDR
jgi:vancomycin permeability regulator SanA